MDDDVEKLAMIFGSKVEPILKRKMAALGASQPSDLPKDVARKVLIEASTEAAITNFPGVNVSKLQHGLKAFTDPMFSAAMGRVRKAVEQPGDAFDMCIGIDAAIVLAGFGIAVAPLDKRNGSLLAASSNDIEAVNATFSRFKTAFVGYNSCEAEFYCLVTDSLQDLKLKIKSDASLSNIAALIDRCKAALPTGNGRPFQHFSAVFAKLPQDRFDTLFLEDPRNDRGSVLFQAGWRDEQGYHGAPHDGYVPVPLALLRGAIYDPQLAFWLTEPTNSRPLSLH